MTASGVTRFHTTVEKAKETLKGEALINARQKVIRIADRSEYGWATVERTS